MIRTALYLSKMTVADEMRDGPLEFSHLKFVEFLEFIGRIAHVYFEKTSHHLEWAMHRKIEIVLAKMLNPLQLKVVVPMERDAFVSDSDDEY